MKIAVIGKSEFTLGFRLTGIKDILDADENPREQIDELIKNAEIGIVVIDEDTVSRADERTKEDIVNSIKPVFVTVSATAAQEELRKMIIKSIGVDLLKD